MSGKRHDLRDGRGRFVAKAYVGTELKRGRGDRVGGRPQIRKKHKRALTAGQIGKFLSVLTETCNISLAAREARRSARTFYDLKKRNPGFRAEWLGALCESYDHLEIELVRRVRFGTTKDVFYQGKKTGTTRVFNDGMALRLLHHHRKTVESLRAADKHGARDAKALFDTLAARIAEMEAEQEAEAKGGEDGEA